MKRFLDKLQTWQWEWLDYLNAISIAISETHRGHKFKPPTKKET